MEKFIVFDIGGTAMKHGILTKAGQILEHGQTPTEASKGGENIVQKLKNIISNYLKVHKIEGVCVSTAGMVCPEEGKIIYAGPTIPNYTGTEIKRVVEKTFDLPCEVENDVNCAALGELWLGAGCGKSSIVCMTIGTGLGGAIILEENIIHGQTYAAGEIGYMIVDGKPIQELASAKALVESVCKRKNESPKIFSGRDVFDGYESGDLICIEEVRKFIDYLAIGVTNVTYMFNPEAIILGGGIMARHEIIFPLLQEALRKYMLPNLLEKTHIKHAVLGNHAGMIGALYHYQKRHQ